MHMLSLQMLFARSLVPPEERYHGDDDNIMVFDDEQYVWQDAIDLPLNIYG